MVLSSADQQQLMEKLVCLKQELRQLLDDSAGSSLPVELDQPIGRLSRVDAMQQQAMAQANRSGHQRRLVLVEAALVAIRQGRYGECRSCEEPISFARLQARPESPFCFECQSRREA